jgi:hypothetical protein
VLLADVTLYLIRGLYKPWMVYVRFFLDKKEPNQPAGWQEIKKERKKLSSR